MKTDEDLRRGTTAHATITTHWPRALHWLARPSEWLFENLPPAARQFKGAIGVAIAIELADLALHIYEVFGLR